MVNWKMFLLNQTAIDHIFNQFCSFFFLKNKTFDFLFKSLYLFNVMNSAYDGAHRLITNRTTRF